MRMKQHQGMVCMYSPTKSRSERNTEITVNEIKRRSAITHTFEISNEIVDWHICGLNFQNVFDHLFEFFSLYFWF